MNVHLIDDDEALHEVLTDYFGNGQIVLTASETPSKGLHWLRTQPVDLVILDVMLPEMDGFEVCKAIRAEWPHMPILMLTARGDDLDTVLGLELGADDYMAKPFNPRELQARIKSILRRQDRAAPPEVTRQVLTSQRWGLRLDLDARSVSLHGQTIELTATEFDLLRVLLENQGIVQSRDALMQKVRGFDWESFDRSIDIYVSKIRQKLGDNSKKPQMIKTVWGIGYMFQED
jgi:two-component system phosphate regulon response regulator OmpR